MTKNILPEKPFLVACSLAFLLCFSRASAQSSSPAPEIAPGSIVAAIGSGSGKERHLNGKDGYIGRAGLRPNQMVRVTLELPLAKQGDPVVVASLDGGRIIPGPDILKVAPAGTVFFNFEAGSNRGLYRVVVETGGRQHLLEFYVLDIEHPENNPPRVRIVD